MNKDFKGYGVFSERILKRAKLAGRKKTAQSYKNTKIIIFTR